MTSLSVVSAFSVLTVLGQLFSVVFLLLLLLREMKWSARLGTHGLVLMLIIALLATGGSLFFSEVLGWTPCRLCWFQRIFMYPQVILLGMALWFRDRGIVRYVLVLSVIGLCIAAFHYAEQVMAALDPIAVDPNVPCDTSGESCRTTPFFHFGYITIPMMALTAFLLNVLGAVFVLRHDRRS